MLRMLEGFLGEDRFRDGIRLYMRRHREANATADDLWGALGEASGSRSSSMANGWIRQTGYPLVDLALARAGAPDTRPSPAPAPVLRRPGRARRRRDATATRWMVPIVLRFRDAKGVKEQPVLFRGRFRDGAAGGGRRRGVVHRQRRGARLLPDGVRRRDAGAACCRAVRDLRPAERIALISDQWALVRAGAGADRALLRPGRQPARRRGPRRAGRDRQPAGADRAPLPGRRATATAFGALSASSSARARRPWLGAARRGEDDETRLRRAVLLRALVAARARPERGRRGRATRFPPRRRRPATSIPTCSTSWSPRRRAAADEARFDELRARARTETDPAAKRRYLHALARVEAPG